jgi:DNA-binding CsgD family transcriptional regulator
MKSAPFDEAIIVNSLTEPGAILKSGFHADVLAPQGIVDSIQVSHKSMTFGGGVGGFGFMLSSRAAERADENARRLQRLTPHLGRALDATIKLGQLTDGTRQLAKVLQLVPNPALLLDSAGRITLANPSAEALLRAGDGLTIDRNGGLQLAAAFPAERSALSQALAQSLAVASGTGDELGNPLRLTRPSGAAPLLVLPVPLPAPAFALWAMTEQARVLVLVIDPSVRSRAAAASVRATFGLTDAEARVAALVGSGFSGPEAAAMLRVSPATVKTHLKRCFEKTGVHSQVGLARIIGALPIDRQEN